MWTNERTPQPITEDEYMDALEMLPPEHWIQSPGWSAFTFMERLTDNLTHQFARLRHDGQTYYYECVVDLTDRRTWMTRDALTDALDTKEMAL